jgi:hypothetical protein
MKKTFITLSVIASLILLYLVLHPMLFTSFHWDCVGISEGMDKELVLQNMSKYTNDSENYTYGQDDTSFGITSRLESCWVKFGPDQKVISVQTVIGGT